MTSFLPAQQVFLAHGSDKAALHEIRGFLAKLTGKDPIVLEDRPSQGQTIIEKVEAHSDVGFAVAILSPDDEGRKKGDDGFNPRARQNVILELGYFIGKLGREKVSCLKPPSADFEIPSDYHGVLYISFDKGGGWKNKLARELKAAGIQVDSNKLIDA